MWWIIIGAIIILIGAIIICCSDSDNEGKTVGFIVILIGMALGFISSSTVMYTRGMPVALHNLPYSLYQGTVYTVIGTANATSGDYTNYAVITDKTRSSYYTPTGWGSEDPNLECAWLIRLTQTNNVVVGKQYVIADNPSASGVDSRILVEIKK